MVIKQKNNGKWEYCVYLGLDERGKKKYKRKSGFTTKKACIKEANKIQNGENIKSSYKTFEDICKLYLKDCELRFLRKTTIRTYKHHINFFKKHFKEYYTDIRKIKTQDIIDFMMQCSLITHRGFTRYIAIKLKAFFNFAIKSKYIDSDIFIDVTLPPKYRGIKKIWSKSDLEKYLPLLERFKYADVIILLLETGLRRGELCALTWDCVDLDRGLISIDKSYVVVSGMRIINPPKTKSSIRTIVLLQRSLDILRRRNLNKKSKYVFYDDKNCEEPLNPSNLYKSFEYFIRKHKLKRITLHDLRHIHATLLLNNNIDYKMLSKRLGHSDVAFTLQTYTHILPDHEINTFKDIGNIF